MLFELFPFTISIRSVTLIGISLWSLALYLGLFPLVEWVTDQLAGWFNLAERSLYQSPEAFEATRSVREAVNRFYASLASITPFLALGTLLNYAVATCLGSHWAINAGLVVCFGCGIYEFGRRSGSAPSQK
jgi:hypothetical protein